VQSRSIFRGGSAGPWAPPGRYAVRLTAGSHSYTQPLTLKMDPRVKTPAPELMKQFTLAQKIAAEQSQVQQTAREGNFLREQIKSLRVKLGGQNPSGGQETLMNQVESFGSKVTAIMGAAPADNPDASGVEQPEAGEMNIRTLTAAWGELDRAVESADAAPTADAVTAFAHDQQLTRKILGEWEEVKNKDLPRLNESLQKANLPLLKVENTGNVTSARKN